MRRLPALLVAIVVGWNLGGTAAADIAFPARLEVEETEPGIYQITFTLPIVEGRKLRARPLLPPACHDATPRETAVSASGHTTTWSVRCEPASLAGEAILIEGLVGTQTDLAFTLTTLEGRVHTGILRPSRPGFLVPEPPFVPALAAEAAAAGMRRTLRQLPLWLLLLTAALLGARFWPLTAAAGAFAIAHALAQWLGGQAWLQIALPARDAFALLSVAVPAVALTGGGERWHGWLRPLWPLAALLGALYGAADPEALSPDGLSRLEQLLAIGFFACGVGFGLMLMTVAAAELEAVLRLTRAGRWRERTVRWLGYLVGVLATGMLLSRLVALGVLSDAGTLWPLELVLLAVILGPTLAAVGRAQAWMVLPFAGLAGVGVAAGLAGYRLPLGSTVVLGSLLLLSGVLAAGRPLPTRWAVVMATVAVLAHAWLGTEGLVENVSRSTGAAVGATLLASCVLFVSLAVARRLVSHPLPVGARLLGAGVAALAVLWRVGEYQGWFDREIATEAALGMVRLPLLALALVTMAVLAWPRQRRVLRELGVERRSRPMHWVALGGAFLLLPFGTLAVRNPLFEPHAPRDEDARRVVSRVLSDTYHAFNLTDESELYDRLAESVEGDLVDDLYLDSRRRLTAGTREGAQVTVREVSVTEIGEPIEAGGSEQAFVYDCRWVVTARVRHLQHVHHRRNIYNGALTLTIDDNRWKIAGVELQSEERMVVPWQPA